MKAPPSSSPRASTASRWRRSTSSLYPSIMMAHNLCYSTLVKGPQNIARLLPDSYAKSPTGDVFVKADTRGILPRVESCSRRGSRRRPT